MKYNLTINLILFRPVTKVKYINNCKAVFDFKHMGLFLIYQGLWALGILSNCLTLGSRSLISLIPPYGMGKVD